MSAPNRFVRALPVVAGAVVATAVAVYLVRAFGFLDRPGAFVSWTLATVSWLVTGLAAIDTALAAGRPGTATGRVLRRFWLLVGASAFSTGAGAALSGALGSGQNTVPMAAFVLYAVGMLLAVAGLIGLPVPWRQLGSRVTVTLDLMIISCATVGILWFTTTELLRVPSDPALTSLALTLGVVAGGGLIAIGKIMLAGWEPVDQMSIRLMAGTMVISVIGAGGLAALSPLTGLTPELLVLPAAAAGWTVAASRQRAVLGVPVEPSRARRKPFSVVPYVAVALFGVVTVVTEINHTPNHERLLFGSVALTTLVIARQVTAFYDNARLVNQLDESLREVRGQEHRFRALVRNSTDVVSISNSEGRITYISPGIEAMLHFTPEEMIGGSGRMLVHPDDQKAFIEQMLPAGAGPGATAQGEARFRRADGSWRWLQVHSTNFYDDPVIQGMVSNARDVTEARRYQEDLAHQATHDDLTGLVNRTLFARVADETLAAGADPERTVMVLVDLDDFKLINDRLGHAVGDALLRDVGARLRNGLRPEDTVARLGGDEFAVLLRDVAPDERMDIARRLMGELERPVTAQGYDLLVRASVGVAPGSSGATAAELLRRADLAMYVAKNQGRGRCVEFDQGMDVRSQEHARLAADLSAAVERTELTLVYQPIVHLPHGELAGVEALVRWTHPVRGFVSPAEFIPVAERTGLIVPLGAWVLYEACQRGAAWMRELGPAAPARISVNVSARQLIEPDFPTVVEAALLASGLPAERLVVEITETAVFDGGPALAAVEAVKDLGVRVALDDFGTGHSSLGLLRTVPLDVLKVDKSFVDGVGQSLEQEAIITSLSQIGAAMRLLVVAEGVETGAQAERLHELGYRFAQGYHFARPLKPEDIAAYAMNPAPV